MMKARWLLLTPLVVLAGLFVGCNEHPTNHTPVADQASETPLFAKGGNPKAKPNPIGCTQDQVAKWDEILGEWVCADGGGGPSVYFMRILKDGTVDFSNLAGITVSNGGTGDYSVTLPVDISNCAIVGTEELVIMGTNDFLLDIERTTAGFDYHTRRDNAFQDQQLDTNFIIACPK
jgi:hypothetical protein